MAKGAKRLNTLKSVKNPPPHWKKKKGVGYWVSAAITILVLFIFILIAVLPLLT